jgi:hypothetical protein
MPNSMYLKSVAVVLTLSAISLAADPATDPNKQSVDANSVQQYSKPTNSDPNAPTAEEVLHRFAETVDKAHTSFITQSRADSISDREYKGDWAYLNGIKERHVLVEFRTDGKRMKRIKQTWGDFYSKKNGKTSTSESEKNYKSDTYDGDKRYDFTKYGQGWPVPGTVIVYAKEPEKSFTVDSHLAYQDPISQCFGYLEGDNPLCDFTRCRPQLTDRIYCDTGKWCNH